MKNLKRVCAFMIDFMIAYGILNLFLFSYRVFLLEAETAYRANYMLLCAILSLCFLFIYLPTKQNGQTIGKMIFHLRVVNCNGKQRTWFQSFLREGVCKFSFVAFLVPIDVMYSLMESIKQRKLKVVFAHDLLLNTTVKG